MEFVNIIGYLAAISTTIAFLPQAIRIWKTKSAKDLSLFTFLIFCIGTMLWLIYGIMLNSLPIIFANSLTMILALTILFFKFKYG